MTGSRQPSTPDPSPLRVGVLAVQGAVSEHVETLRRAAQEEGFEVEVVLVRRREELDGLAGIILPGGESTAISRLLRSAGMEDDLIERTRSGDLAIFGTCAGMVLLASAATHDVEEKGVHLLGLLEAEVDRNAYGRQRDSHEAVVEVAGVGPVRAAYIRAPVLTRVWGTTEALAQDWHGIVAARRGRVLATAFHPEVAGDTTVHRWFLKMCAGRE